MTTITQQKYVGEIVSVKENEDYGFVGISTVTKADGTPHDLENEKDVFIHQDECNTTLRVGLIVQFYTTADNRRGEGAVRASGAIVPMSTELIPDAIPVPGFPVSAPLSRVNPKAASYLAKMKQVPDEAVETAIKNNAMPDIPRDEESLPYSDDEKAKMLQAFLYYLFPTMADYGADFSVENYDEEELDRQVELAKRQLQELGVTAQIPVLEREVGKFKGVHRALEMIWQDGLVKPGAIIPIKYLPDVFMAAPVWYHWRPQSEQRDHEQGWADDDPRPHNVVQYFCNLFRADRRWTDTFQLFNRRVRLIKHYDGDIIPPHIIRRIGKATELFDYVVIATPYLEVAGRDWEDLDWIRSIDPYVLGFMEGLPIFFVLARFSDSGTFPLHNELVGDTLDFLKNNKQKLEGFNRARGPYWYDGRDRSHCEDNLGSYLQRHVVELLKAADAGHLFDWLRGECDVN